MVFEQKWRAAMLSKLMSGKMEPERKKKVRTSKTQIELCMGHKSSNS